jgi:transposase
LIDEGWAPADEDGLASMVVRLGPDAVACLEMMSGAAWVRDRLHVGGWTVQVADARKAKAVGSLAAKTDKLDARVLAELARRDLVPQVHVPTFADRELKERLGRRMHMVRLRTAAMNRAHGVLSQFGVTLAFKRLRGPDREELLIARGIPEVWRRSITEAVAVVAMLDQRLIPLEQELRPLARADPRVRLLITIPGVGDLLGLTIASEIGDISRFPSARKLIGYSGLDPARLPVRTEGAHREALEVRVDDAAIGRDRSRPAGLAPEQPVEPALPRRQAALRRQGQPRQGRRRPQGADRHLARPRLATALQPFAPPAARALLSRPAPVAFWPTHGPQGIEKPGQLRPTRCAQASAERELSDYRIPDPERKAPDTDSSLTSNFVFKENQRARASARAGPARGQARLRRAWALDDHARALDQLRRLAAELDHSHPGAAGSLREGMEETLTLTRLGVTGSLKRTLESTNPCESMIEIVRRTQRNVKRWSSGEKALRWTAAGMLEAERQFRRVIGYRDLATLVIAIERDHDTRRHTDTAHTPTKEAAIVLTA